MARQKKKKEFRPSLPWESRPEYRGGGLYLTLVIGLAGRPTLRRQAARRSESLRKQGNRHDQKKEFRPPPWESDLDPSTEWGPLLDLRPPHRYRTEGRPTLPYHYAPSLPWGGALCWQ